MSKKNGVLGIFFGLIVVTSNGVGSMFGTSGTTEAVVSDCGVRAIVELRKDLAIVEQADGSYNIQ